MDGCVRGVAPASKLNAPHCSIIIPCRNEVRHINACLDSIFANDFPAAEYEVVVADGMSTDGTRQVLANYGRAHPNLRIVDNVRRTTPAGLNAAIRASRGQIIIRIDAHSRIEPDYLAACVAALEASGADNVGGRMRTHPEGAGFFARSIGLVLSHRFGVGNSMFRVHSDKPEFVDTVFGGCYRRDVFERVGYFNERLVRGQDMEFNRRLKNAGGRILFLPHIVSHYYARSDLFSFCRHNWMNGKWAILPFIHSDVVPVSLRHLVPLGFVVCVMLCFALAVVWSVFAWTGAAILLAYAGIATGAAGHVCLRERHFRLLPVVLIVFAVLHFSYGVGSLWALVRLPFVRETWQSNWVRRLGGTRRRKTLFAAMPARLGVASGDGPTQLPHSSSNINGEV